MQRYQYINMVRAKKQGYHELKYRGTKTSWIMLENAKKILQICIVEQRQREKNKMYDI